MTLLAVVSTVSAYVIGVIVSFVLILIAALVSNAIAYRPDLTDVCKRKMWFWVFAFLCPVISFGFAYLLVYMGIRAHTQRTSYMTAMCIAAGISFVLYIILGFIAAKFNKTGKISNWFKK